MRRLLLGFALTAWAAFALAQSLPFPGPQNFPIASSGTQCGGQTCPFDLHASGLFGVSPRLLRAAYAGKSMNIRRASDNATTDIGFDGSGNFDGTAFTTHCTATTCFLAKWYDQSGAGNDCPQATAGKQPQVVLSVLNSQPALTFVGASVQNCTVASPSPTSITNLTQYIVAVSGDSATNVRLTAGCTSGGQDFSSGWTLLWPSPTTTTVGNSGQAKHSGYIEEDTAALGANVWGQVQAWQTTAGSNNLGVKLNQGTAVQATTSAPSNSLGTATIAIGSRGADSSGLCSGTGNNFNGKAAEIVMFQADYASQTDVSASQKAYWATP